MDLFILFILYTALKWSQMISTWVMGEETWICIYVVINFFNLVMISEIILRHGLMQMFMVPAG